MVEKNTLTLKESELITFMSTMVREIINEQDVDWKDIPYLDPNRTPAAQIEEKTMDWALTCVQCFVDYWFERCKSNNIIVKYINNNTDEAIECWTSMPQAHREFLKGPWRREIGAMWIKKWEAIEAQLNYIVDKQKDPSHVANLTPLEMDLLDDYQDVILRKHQYREDYAKQLKIIEYVADIVGVVAMFFGPGGWVVAGAAGLISAWAMYEQGNVGGAMVVGLLELVPGLKLMKHLKHVKRFKNMSNNSMSKSLNFFSEPTEQAYKKLSKVEKQLVDYSIKNKWLIKKLLKNSDLAVNTRKVVLDIKTVKQFRKYAKSAKGKELGLDKTTWNQFKEMRDNLSKAQKTINNIKDGVIQAAPYAVALVPGLYAVSWAMYSANYMVFANIISETDDLITSKKLGGNYHYKYDRVLNQSYPYNTSFTKCEDYEESFTPPAPGLPKDILLLVKIWRDKSFGEVIPDGGCLGVEMDEVANPGGGWRPNLCCLNEFSLTPDKIAEIKEVFNTLNELMEDVQEGTITEYDAAIEAGKHIGLTTEESKELKFPTYESIEDSIQAADYTIY